MSSWKTIEINGEVFVLEITTNPLNNDLIECSLSDFKCLWKESLKMDDLMHRVQIENPLIEYDRNKILEAIKSAETYQFTIDEINSNVARLKIKTYISRVPFQFYWHLELCKQDTFLDKITKPLLIALVDAQMHRNALVEIVKQKDVEIGQYKIEGATLIRKHVSTLPFEETDFNDKFLKSNTTNAHFIDLIKNNNNLLAICKLCNVDSSFSSISGQCDGIANGQLAPKEKIQITPRKAKKSIRDSRALKKFQGKSKMKLNYKNINDDRSSVSSSDGSDDNSNILCKTPKTSTISKKPKIMQKLNL